MKTEFMKIRIFLNLICVAALLFSCNKPAEDILIEAESFSNKGGWVVDPQFVEQMGSPYLLAHGLGNPVENAKTEIKLPSAGKYYVWARTKNWAPGEWKAPGRFKIIFNGKELEPELGTEEGWGWQRAGTIKSRETACNVEIKDLTGFDARCDALFLSTVDAAPPGDPAELMAWRKEKLNESEDPVKTGSFDLVITGGGIAGCAAAIAAAEQGLKVALIHDRPVLGGNASGEIRVHMEGIPWKAERILNMLNSSEWFNGSPEALKDDIKRDNSIRNYKNIELFLNWRAYTSNAENDSITSVDARHTSTGETMRFSAPLFIDCTGDGWIGYWAGADYFYGREDSSEYHENWDKYKELWSPGKKDGRIMGSSILWRSSDRGKPVTFPEVPWAMDISGEYSATEGTWNWEYSKDGIDQIDDAEQIRDHMLKAIYGSFYNAKQKPGNENLALEWTSYLIGKRESRRLAGDYIYTFADEKRMTEFPDAVAMEKREIDVHYQQNLMDESKPDFLAEANYYKLDHYYIPYRSLYSRNIKNLLMAGRCFSCSHAGLGGPRVMYTTGQMGVAAGYAASLCRKYNTSPRGVYLNHITELKKLIDDSGNDPAKR